MCIFDKREERNRYGLAETKRYDAESEFQLLT